MLSRFQGVGAPNGGPARNACRCSDVVRRAWRKQRKIEARLGNNGAKPKGMHWATYERLQHALAQCETTRDAALQKALAGLFRPAFRGKSKPTL